MSAVLRFATLLLLITLASCHRADSRALSSAGATMAATMELTSPSIANGQIPKQFTCDGADFSPQLAWTAPPPGTKSLSLIVTDPDASVGTFTHWLLYDLPASRHSLAEGLPNPDQLPDGSRQGRNDFGKIGYGGPCPPRNSAHRYIFTLYALSTVLDLPPGATRDQVEAAVKGRVLAQGKLTARYGR